MSPEVYTREADGEDHSTPALSLIQLRGTMSELETDLKIAYRAARDWDLKIVGLGRAACELNTLIRALETELAEYNRETSE